MSCCYPITNLFKKDKKTTEQDKTSPASSGQEQYKVTKQHNYDEVDLDQASTEPNWEVEKKPRNYDEIEIGANQSEQRSRKQGVGPLNYIEVEFTDKTPTKPKMSVSEKEASKVTYSEVTVDAQIYENQ
ncbi:uncharacterized protein LOC110458437 isoform X2 [Mizuhopecten yessoensis]|uniref:uncharacterized protein LOC110458437 isoform X2 n=1 Tax=Mizuhopecten yessoensis TaxID=6573 RepID=UPI000B45A1B0|nr:uncharacterized protein LOC110458437 isoform X2 [Mizuhopecten yessoensis]